MVPAAEARLGYAEIVWVVVERFPIGAHVEDDGERAERAHPAAGGVERELPDRDRQAVVALIPDAEDRRRVGGHDHLDVVRRMRRDDLLR